MPFFEVQLVFQLNSWSTHVDKRLFLSLEPKYERFMYKVETVLAHVVLTYDCRATRSWNHILLKSTKGSLIARIVSSLANYTRKSCASGSTTYNFGNMHSDNWEQPSKLAAGVLLD